MMGLLFTYDRINRHNRGCLEKWHQIEKGRALTDAEIGIVVETILGWILEKAGQC